MQQVSTQFLPPDFCQVALPVLITTIQLSNHSEWSHAKVFSLVWKGFWSLATNGFNSHCSQNKINIIQKCQRGLYLRLHFFLETILVFLGQSKVTMNFQSIKAHIINSMIPISQLWSTWKKYKFNKKDTISSTALKLGQLLHWFPN